jgi:protoporphyrinogen IX oxidase
MSSASSSVVLVFAHVLANVVWIGSILAVGLLLGRARFMADGAEIGALARRVYTRLAVPAFLGSFAFGAARVAMDARVYAHMPWFHAKLTFAIGVIALHHVIGARARRVAAGSPDAGKGATVLMLATFLCAAGAVWLGVAKQLP